MTVKWVFENMCYPQMTQMDADGRGSRPGRPESGLGYCIMIAMQSLRCCTTASLLIGCLYLVLPTKHTKWENKNLGPQSKCGMRTCELLMIFLYTARTIPKSFLKKRLTCFAVFLMQILLCCSDFLQKNSRLAAQHNHIERLAFKAPVKTETLQYCHNE